MGTRGGMGFRIERQDNVQYNQYDAYPDGLGTVMVEFVTQMLTEGKEAEYAALAKGIRLIDENTEPTAEDRAQYARYTDSNVSTGKDWYATLRQLQGDPMGTLNAGVMLDGSAFLKNGPFCEYAYIINFDERALEFYRGFCKDEAQCKGRYVGHADKDGYCPVTLSAVFTFDVIVNMGAVEVVKAMNELDAVEVE